MKRRAFLQTAAAAVPASMAAKQDIPRRPYRDGVQLSVIGFGGIVVVGMDAQQAARTVAASFDRGVNYFDVAPSYWDGEAEIKLGDALQPYRQRVFLACKTGRRDAAGAREELERSLSRLHTDHFDLYQFHAVSSMKDVEAILAPGGAAEVFLEAKKQGKVRFVGFSAHHAGAAIALMDRFPCDSMLFPVNFAAWSQGDFGPQMLAHAKKKGVARLALKGMALARWPEGTNRQATKYPKCWYQPVEDPALAALALRFTLSEDVTAAIPPGDERLYAAALGIAAGFKRLGKAEREQLFARAQGLDPVFRA